MFDFLRFCEFRTFLHISLRQIILSCAWFCCLTQFTSCYSWRTSKPFANKSSTHRHVCVWILIILFIVFLLLLPGFGVKETREVHYLQLNLRFTSHFVTIDITVVMVLLVILSSAISLFSKNIGLNFFLFFGSSCNLTLN